MKTFPLVLYCLMIASYRWAETCSLINFNLFYDDCCDWWHSHYFCIFISQRDVIVKNKFPGIIISSQFMKGLRTMKTLNTGLFISPSEISELDCATTKTDTAERSISIRREYLQVFFVLGALAYFQVPPLGGSRDEKWRSQWIRKRSVSWN